MSRAYAFTAYGGPEVETFVDVPTPTPGPGQLLVRVYAAGVNPSDWKRRAGIFGRPPIDGAAVIGGEASGVVEAGEGDGFAPGDAVFGYPATGGFAEYTLFPVELTARKPDGVSFVHAATLPIAAATAYDMVDNLDLPAGASVLILGAGGGVGVAAAQIARHRGLTVLGLASAAKHDLLRTLGVVPVQSGDGAADRVRALAPDGVAGIVDLVGGPALEAVGALAAGGNVVTGSDPATAEKFGGHVARRDRGRRVLDAVAALAAEGRLDPLVSATYPLAEADRAMREVESGHARGKVVVEVTA